MRFTLLQRALPTIALVLSLSFSAFGQPCTTDTGYNSSLILPPAFQPALNGQPVADSTEIRIVSSDGECVGHLVYAYNDTSGQYTPIWGEDAQFNPGPGIPVESNLFFQIKPPTSDTWLSAQAGYAPDTPNNTSGKYSHDEFYVLESLASDGSTTGTGEESKMPQGFALKQNYPNPFNPTTTIPYEVPRATHVRVTIYNAQGQEVAQLVNRAHEAGGHSVQWEAKNNPSGIYFYRLKAGSYSNTRKLILIK